MCQGPTERHSRRPTVAPSIDRSPFIRECGMRDGGRPSGPRALVWHGMSWDGIFRSQVFGNLITKNAGVEMRSWMQQSKPRPVNGASSLRRRQLPWLGPVASDRRSTSLVPTGQGPLSQRDVEAKTSLEGGKGT